MFQRRDFHRLALAAGAASLLRPALAAGRFPERPLHLVVPFAPGGAVDTVGRTLGERLSAQLGVSVIVENRPGANANLGAEYVARAAPDGYTLLVGANGLATNNTLYPRLGFQALKDFTPISRLGSAPLVLVTAAGAPWDSVKALVAAARAKPGSFNYGSAGNGSSGHLASALFCSVAQIDAQHVAYKGGSPALVDLIANRLSFMLLNPLEVLPHLQSGRLKALAVTGEHRSPLLPQLQTLTEAGLAGVNTDVWWMLLGPAGLPAEVLQALSRATTQALADAHLVERLGALGASVIPSSPEQAGQFLSHESQRWAQLIHAAHIEAD